uniref:contactin-5-like n=1 Tax=Scatophagus argus TaxID=75038 RepID=UPI001ED7D954|nr:contactin-5-like [Scatophagus argus]
MLLAQAGCVFMGFILYISGVQGQTSSICAFKGSSVDLTCSPQHPTSPMKWYTVHWNGSAYVQNELAADGNRVTYNMSEENHPTLTIKDVRESDQNSYCCGEKTQPTRCWYDQIQLRVTELQVKVIPTTEGHTVTLMCSTSCPLNENPAAYMWYKNREFLYQDWSPWYQQLVSSEEAVRYSCAIKGYEDLRAPEVSVDSVTSSCFKVTYAGGTMCSSQQTSVDEPCSITYPTDIHVQRSPAALSDHIRLTCNTSCPLTAFIWYKNRLLQRHSEKSQILVPSSSGDSFSCAVKGHEDLLSTAVCVVDNNCWSVNYVSRRICALRGSSVNISSEYSHPNQQPPKSKSWYKVKRSGTEGDEEQMKAAGRVSYHDNMKNLHILTITNLTENDSAEYTFRLQKDESGWTQSDFPVTLVVTGVKVDFSPSAVVTEGQRVTLTCSTTSCPLTDDTNYIWYLNSQPLTLPQDQSKHLLLDPVSRQHAGNYSCAVKTLQIISSHENTLTVQSVAGNWTAAAAGVGAALLVLTTSAVFWWIWRKRTSAQFPQHESTDNMEQINPGPLYENISAPRAEPEQLYYETVHFSKTQTDRSTVQPRQPQEQELVTYAVVNFGSSRTPELMWTRSPQKSLSLTSKCLCRNSNASYQLCAKKTNV